MPQFGVSWFGVNLVEETAISISVSRTYEVAAYSESTKTSIVYTITVNVQY